MPSHSDTVIDSRGPVSAIGAAPCVSLAEPADSDAETGSPAVSLGSTDDEGLAGALVVGAALVVGTRAVLRIVTRTTRFAWLFSSKAIVTGEAGVNVTVYAGFAARVSVYEHLGLFALALKLVKMYRPTPCPPDEAAAEPPVGTVIVRFTGSSVRGSRQLVEVMVTSQVAGTPAPAGVVSVMTMSPWGQPSTGVMPMRPLPHGPVPNPPTADESETPSPLPIRTAPRAMASRPPNRFFNVAPHSQRTLGPGPTAAYASAMSTPVAPRVLVRRGVDGLLVGWLAVIVWFVVLVGPHLGWSLPAPLFDAVYWAGAVVVAAHFGVSYHLAYARGGEAVRQRPGVLLTAPLVLLLVLGGTVALSVAGGTEAAGALTRALVASVYLMTTWHYVKQVYGVGRVGAAYAGVKLGEWDVRVLRYGLYPMWFLGAAAVLVHGPKSVTAGVVVGYDLLPAAAVDVLQIAAIVAAVPVGLVLARIVVNSRKIPSLLVGPYVAAFLWLVMPTDALAVVLLLATFHALQYLAIAHRAEVSLAADSAEGPSVTWWLNIFVGAACGGMLLSTWAPQFLDSMLADGRGTLFAAAFFVFLNLHHYLIDASIWRSKGELIKALGRPQRGPQHQAPVASDGLGRRPDPAPQGAVG